jgi:DNA-binding MarR family transcriptional regulator
MSGTTSSSHSECQQKEAQNPTPWEVLEALGTTVHAIRRYVGAWLAHHQPLPLDPDRLSGPRMRTLHVVAEATSLRMSDLAAQLGVAARTVTDMVDGLERDGLLVRRSDPTDRRATLIELSEEMSRLWEEVRLLQHQCSDEIMTPLNADERQQLFDLLNRLKAGPLREAITGRVWPDEM